MPVAKVAYGFQLVPELAAAFDKAVAESGVSRSRYMEVLVAKGCGMDASQYRRGNRATELARKVRIYREGFKALYGLLMDYEGKPVDADPDELRNVLVSVAEGISNGQE